MTFCLYCCLFFRATLRETPKWCTALLSDSRHTGTTTTAVSRNALFSFPSGNTWERIILCFMSCNREDRFLSTTPPNQPQQQVSNKNQTKKNKSARGNHSNASILLLDAKVLLRKQLLRTTPLHKMTIPSCMHQPPTRLRSLPMVSTPITDKLGRGRCRSLSLPNTAPPAPPRPQHGFR